MTATDDETGPDERVRRALADNEVVLFLHGSPPEPPCPFSRRALSLVDRHREEYATVDVLGDPGAFRGVLRERSGWETVPQAYVDGEFVGDDGLMAAFEERGELRDRLLAD